MSTQGQKKGFRLPERTAVMEFEGGEYEGAEVRVRLDVPLSYFLDVQGLLASDAAWQGIPLFIDQALLGWNLVDAQGEAIPATLEGARQVSQAFISLVITRWAELIAGVSGPLAGESPNGFDAVGLDLSRLSTPN